MCAFTRVALPCLRSWPRSGALVHAAAGESWKLLPLGGMIRAKPRSPSQLIIVLLLIAPHILKPWCRPQIHVDSSSPLFPFRHEPNETLSRALLSQSYWPAHDLINLLCVSSSARPPLWIPASIEDESSFTSPLSPLLQFHCLYTIPFRTLTFHERLRPRQSLITPQFAACELWTESFADCPQLPP